MDTMESNIIPFPIKIRASAARRQPIDGLEFPQLTAENLHDNRLKTALEKLRESVDEQQKAVADYRESIKALKESVLQLQTKVHDYDQRVSKLDVRPLRVKARRLYSIMDDWEKRNAAGA